MTKMCSLCGYPMGNSTNSWLLPDNKKEFIHVRCHAVWKKGYKACLDMKKFVKF